MKRYNYDVKVYDHHPDGPMVNRTMHHIVVNAPSEEDAAAAAIRGHPSGKWRDRPIRCVEIGGVRGVPGFGNDYTHLVQGALEPLPAPSTLPDAVERNVAHSGAFPADFR